jgi:hypothetical protein
LQVAAAQSPLSQSSLPMYQQQTAFAAGGQIATRTQAEAAPATKPEGEAVSLHTTAEIQASQSSQPAAANLQPEVFAEIWKDGMRIGSIYTDGRAVMAAGAGIPLGAGGLPYLQAQEISRRVGGEVRYVDMHALHVAQTRGQLRAAYGV